MPDIKDKIHAIWWAPIYAYVPRNTTNWSQVMFRDTTCRRSDTRDRDREVFRDGNPKYLFDTALMNIYAIA